MGAVAAVLLAGCGGSPPAPKQTFATYTPTVTQSATPTPEPNAESVVEPARPAEMERSDQTGAAAAATHFMLLFEYVLMTGDHEEWDRIGGSSRFVVNRPTDAGVHAAVFAALASRIRVR